MSPTSLQIEGLFNNNDEPSNAVLREIQAILAGPRKELATLDSEIQQLENRIAELKIQRNRIQESTSRYDIILSPIRRLPIDVLHTIFYHCLPTHRNSLMIDTEAPVLLTRVCRKWRTIALSSPRIWSQIHITFSNEDLRLEDPLRPDAHIYTDGGIDVVKTLRTRCKAVEEWLSRSGTCPLSISLNYQKFYGLTINDNPEAISDITLQLLSILCKFSDSWQNVQLDVTFEIYDLMERMISVPTLKALNTLKISLSTSGWALEDGSRQPVAKMVTAPNLKQLSMFAGNRPRLPIIPPSWRSLTDISCHSTITVPETITILTTCANLVQFMVTIQTVYPSVPATLHQKVISLPHLRVFHIQDYALVETIGDLYECIHAPRLEWVEYSNKSPSGGVNDDYPAGPPIVTLLQKSSALKKLTIEMHRCAQWNIRLLLESARSITHLVMGREMRVYDGGPLRRELYASNYFNWAFNELFEDNLEGLRDIGPGSTGDSTVTTFLPNLQSLEISNGVPINVQEEFLLRFILRRMNPSSNIVAVLKRVSIFYNRGTTINIAEDVYWAAQSKGIDIKLELDYNGISPRERFTHPRYGLDRNNDRSWNALDNDDWPKMMPPY